MADFFNNVKLRFKQKDILIQLIVINIAVFVVLGVLNIFTTLFKFDLFNLVHYLGVPSDVSTLLIKPWTLITYMFTHEGLWHIFFNMLILYIFGQMFLQFFNSRNLGSLYLIGGLGGALLYVLAYNTIPYYIDLGPSYMIGASASVSAIIFGVAFYKPNYEVGFILISRVKIIYIALIFFAIDFLSLSSSTNPGGHIAHIGGALTGLLYAKLYLKGMDITKWLSKLIDGIANLFKPKAKKPKMKVKFKNRETDYEYNQRKKENGERIDQILDKIKSSGYSSLNDEEKKQLFDASKK